MKTTMARKSGTKQGAAVNSTIKVDEVFVFSDGGGGLWICLGIINDLTTPPHALFFYEIWFLQIEFFIAIVAAADDNSAAAPQIAV